MTIIFSRDTAAIFKNGFAEIEARNINITILK